MTSVAAAPAFARMAAIQARFTPPSTAPTTTGSAADFASLLSSVTGTSSLGDADTSSVTSTSMGDEVVQVAETYQGIPYLWGGTDPERGLDCSGFVQHVYRQFGIELPRVSRDQARQGTEVPSIDQARPGDLVAFGEPVDHIAIYVGDGKIIHAPRTGDVVRITDMHRTPTAIRRLVPDTASSSSSLNGGGMNGYGMNGYGMNGYGMNGYGVNGGATAAAGSVVASTPALAPYAHLFAQAGARYGIDPNVLAAVAKVESGGNASAVSPAGAKGLMQFMPGTARGMGIDPLDPAQAVDGAARLLTQLQGRLGSLELALAGYNAGEGAVRRHGGIPPYSETQQYVSKIMNLVGGGR